MSPDDWILGIDEAGRGPVLGSMVLAGLWVRRRDLHSLSSSGAADSKKLSHKKRESIEARLLDLGMPFRRLVFSARELDAGNLNTLCLGGIVRMVAERPPHELQLDAPVPSRRLPNYRDKVRALLHENALNVQVITAENHAEDLFPAVAAASILAKTKRDRLLRSDLAPYESQFGSAGSGYPSDPTTRNFIRNCLSHGELPPVVRSRWGTIKNIQAEMAQAALFK